MPLGFQVRIMWIGNGKRHGKLSGYGGRDLDVLGPEPNPGDHRPRRASAEARRRGRTGLSGSPRRRPSFARRARPLIRGAQGPCPDRARAACGPPSESRSGPCSTPSRRARACMTSLTCWALPRVARMRGTAMHDSPRAGSEIPRPERTTARGSSDVAKCFPG